MQPVAESASSANTQAGHRKRISTASLPQSYAYGAPLQSTSTLHYHDSPAANSNAMSRSMANAETLGVNHNAAPLPAAVRYAQYKQPAPITKSMLPSLGGQNGTSVNIATAFLQATRDIDQEPENAGPEGTMLTKVQDSASPPPQSLKKRKKLRTKDASYRPGQEEEESDESVGSSTQARGKRRRKSGQTNGRSTLEDELQDAEQENQPLDDQFAMPAPRKPARRKSTSKDLSYRPTRDDDSSSEEDLDKQSSRNKNSRRGPRISTPGPRLLGAYPDSTPSGQDEPTSYKLALPADEYATQYNHEESSSNYDLESEHVRQQEAAWSERERQRSRSVAQHVLDDPDQHREASAQAPSLSQLQTRRREFPAASANNQSFVDGLGPEAEETSRKTRTKVEAGQAAGETIGKHLLQLYSSTIAALHWPLEHMREWKWTTAFRTAAIVVFCAVIIGSLLQNGFLSRLAKGWVSDQSPVFDLPSERPDSFEALVSRLSAVEKATSDLSSLYSDSRSRTFSDFKDMSKRLDSMQAFLHDVSRDASRSGQQAQDALSQLKDFSHRSDKASTHMQDQIKGLVSQYERLLSTTGTDHASLSKMSSHIDALQQSTRNVDSKVSKALEDLQKAIKIDQIKEIAAHAIEQVLPKRLAVQVDQRSGKVVLDPAFWSHLQSAFAPRDGSNAKHPASSGKAVAVNWNDFLSANERSLRTLISSNVDDRLSDGAILSKKAFMDLLKRELKQLKSNFEQTANDNVQRIGEEILRKVDKQQQMKQPATTPESKITLKLPDGSNVTDIVQTLIDDALLQYSKDTLAKRDYALFTGGARIIPALTSPSYEIRPSGVFRKTLASLTGNGIVRGRPPVTALHPDLSVGSCWSFAGPHAQLGIRLSRRVVVSDITIEHASPDVAYDTSTAPADFEVWGVVDDPSDVAKLASSLATEPTTDYVSSMPPSKNNVLLAVGTYNPSSASHIQSFPVLSSASQLEIPVSVVLLRILGTHGGGMGCLYRMRVGGREV